jgi:microcystin-dependent protein
MSDPFIAEIIMFGGNFAPRGWALCDGQLLPISQNTALFSILGTTYGGDGRSTFGLPDLRGRSPVHEGGGPGLPNTPLGQKSGNSTTTLNTGSMPNHTHVATSTSTAHAVAPGGNSNDAVGNFWADDVGVSSGTYHTGPATGQMNAGAVTTVTTIQANGSSTPFNNYHPYTVVNFIIALQGVFPSRN